MIPIYQTKLIQIEVTNACHLRCANCTRFIGQHSRPYYMDLATVVKAIESLEGYKGGIGLMGGEPTLHPKFPEICKIYQKMIPERHRRGLWTAGYKWNEYKKIIYETFDEDLITYNDHSDPDEGCHQPLLVAIEEVVEDKELMWKLINNCWVQLRWSASITPKGAFFCEVAAARDHMFEGPGGWPIEKGWWKKTPEEFQDQVRRYCPRCSACLPMPIPNNHDWRDTVSKGNALLLEKVRSPKYMQGGFIIADIEKIKEYLKGCDGVPGPEPGSLRSHPEWTPWMYRPQYWADKVHGPKEGSRLKPREVVALQRGKLSPEEARATVEARKRQELGKIAPK